MFKGNKVFVSQSKIKARIEDSLEKAAFDEFLCFA